MTYPISSLGKHDSDKKDFTWQLRYHGRWIDSVCKSRSYASPLKANLINLDIFGKLNSYRMQSYLWNSQLNRPRSDKLPEFYTSLYLNCRDLFYLEDFRRRHWYYVARVKASSFTRQKASQKEETIRCLNRLHLHLRLTLSLWKFRNRVRSQQFRETSTCCSLSFSFIGGTSLF